MEKNLAKTYDPKDFEDRIYEMWESNGACARSATVGSAFKNRSKYGFTASTRVCCSMISDTQTRYGRGSSLHGRTRAFLSYHVSSFSGICCKISSSVSFHILLSFTSCLLKYYVLPTMTQMTKNSNYHQKFLLKSFAKRKKYLPKL